MLPTNSSGETAAYMEQNYLMRTVKQSVKKYFPCTQKESFTTQECTGLRIDSTGSRGRNPAKIVQKYIATFDLEVQQHGEQSISSFSYVRVAFLMPLAQVALVRAVKRERHQNPTVATGNIMTVTLLFRELIRKPTQEWTTERLRLLPVKELASMSQLVGISHTGTKQELVERLVDQTQLQRCIRHYWTTLDEEVTTSQIKLLANTYPGRELKAMCRRAGCYAGSTKYAMAGSLIGWSRACIRKGREVYYQAKKEALASPTRQLMLNV